ncbi:hypothetical protein ACWDRB_32165 [Nonomuraea sp. NPDC003707]
MLLRLAYLTVTNTFAALRLLPMSDRDKDMEILALRHQVTVPEQQLSADTSGTQKYYVYTTPSKKAVQAIKDKGEDVQVNPSYAAG